MENSAEAGVIITNNDLERLRVLVASGMTWREAQAQDAKFQHVPLQSLWAMCKTGKVFPKYQRHDDRARPRLIVAVSAEQKRTVSEAAKAAGMTEARWIRIRLGLEE